MSTLVSSSSGIGFIGNLESRYQFIESDIRTCNTFIKHYEFVIQDLQKDIINSQLEENKSAAIKFLMEVKEEWEITQEKLKAQLKEVRQKNKQN